MNDFTEVHGYIEYHSYGKGHLQIFNCSVAKGQHRGWNVADDHIYVFLNYKQIGKFKDKVSAREMLVKLLADCPREAQEDFDSHAQIMLDLVS